jgi:hypothetical protein
MTLPDPILAAARQTGINAHGNADSTARADEAERSVNGTRRHAGGIDGVTAFRDAGVPMVFPLSLSRRARTRPGLGAIRSIRFIRPIRIPLNVEANHARWTRRLEEPSQ